VSGGDGLGYVVIGGHRFPVDGVRLIRGAVDVTFTIRGPVAPFSGHVTVFGEDGRGIMQGHEMKIGGVKDGDTWECHEELKFTKIESYDEQREY
jgi:hypothetical protein